MQNRNKPMFRAMLLSLLLIAGSVQAHVSYFCGMMDAVVHDDCCCDGMDSGDLSLTDAEPCCDKSLSIGIESTMDQAQSVAKPVKFQSDVDPPPALELNAVIWSRSAQVSSMPGHSPSRSRRGAGSETYLITRRLRI
jgi:hypothetical protein